eukprot:scaffold19216_cov97-Isochrysis_galbana.AAC.3
MRTPSQSRVCSTHVPGCASSGAGDGACSARIRAVAGSAPPAAEALASMRPLQQTDAPMSMAQKAHNGGHNPK